MHTLWQEIRHSLRKLRKNPGFTAVAVLILGLGIGANTSIFSIVNAVLLRPLPYGKPEQLFVLYERNLGTQKPKEPVSPANYFDWAGQSQTLQQIGASKSSTYNLTGSGDPEAILGYRLTDNFFQLLDARPLIGRTFQPEGESGEGPSVVLSYRLWQRRFGGRQDIVGQTLTLDGKPYPVIGVMPRDFQYPTIDTELWTPLRMSPEIKSKRDARLLRVVARVKPGMSAVQAQNEMDTIARRLEQSYPDVDAGWGVRMVPLHVEYVGDVAPYMFLLLGAAGFVLLIACTNLTSLFLVRAAGRQKEIAIRSSLGASRKRIIGSLLIEGALLALLGGIVGLLLAWMGRDALVSFFPKTISNLEIPRVTSLPLDINVLGFTFLLCFLSSLMFGLLPAIQSSSPNLNGFLKEGVKGTSGGFSSGRFRNLLIVSEVSLAFALMIGAGLMIRSFERIRQSKLGFDPNQLLTMRIQLPPAKYKEDQQRNAFYNQVLQRVRVLPGVQSVGIANFLPLSGWWNTLPFVIEGRPAVSAGQEPEVDYRVVSPDYFATMNTPLIKGRHFTDADNDQSPQVIIINETMARRYWPGEDPLGRRIKFIGEHKDDWREVVGVVGDIKHFSPDVEAKPEAYRPYLQEPWPQLGLVVRTSGDPTVLAPALRNEIHAVDSDQPISYVMSMNDLVSESVATRQVSMVLLIILGSVALMLASLGIYGVLSYSILQRTHEIGVRMALGAEQRDLLKLILGQSLKLIAIGVVVGVALGLLMIRFFSSLLFGVSPADPLTFTAVTVVIVLTALAASYLPARRAMRVDPIVALRNE